MTAQYCNKIWTSEAIGFPHMVVCTLYDGRPSPIMKGRCIQCGEVKE